MPFLDEHWLLACASLVSIHHHTSANLIENVGLGVRILSLSHQKYYQGVEVGKHCNVFKP